MERIKNFIKLWPEVWAIPAVMLGFWLSYQILGFIDPTFGQFDIGYLQVLVLTAIAIVVINALVFMGIEFNWGPAWKYYKEEIKSDFETFTPWQKTILLLSLYCFLFLMAVVVFVALV